MTTNAPVSRLLPVLLLLPVLSAAGHVAADDVRRIEALQLQIGDLRARVERLETQLQAGVPVHPARKVQPVPGGWRKAANWGLLVKGLSDYEVVKILGEPEGRKTVNKYEFWHYGDGKARFYLRRLKSWELPGDAE